MIKIRGKVTGLAETSSAINQIPSLLRQAGEGAMTETLELVSKTVRDDFLRGPYPEEIARRSGSFTATFRRGHAENIFTVHSQDTRIIGTFGSTDKRARILNDGSGYLPGGVLRSSRPGGFLAVRSDFTKTAGGVVKKKYQAPLRSLPHTFVRPIRARKAKAAVFEKIGKRIIPIAWLVESVKIVGRHFLEKTIAKTQPQFTDIFRQRFQQVLDRMSQTLRNIRGR